MELPADFLSLGRGSVSDTPPQVTTTFLTKYSFVVNNYLCNLYFVTYISFKRLFIYIVFKK